MGRAAPISTAYRQNDCHGGDEGYCGEALHPLMPSSLYAGGKVKRHFTLSQGAVDHLSAIASDAGLSRSETMERLIRSTPVWEGGATFSNGAWPLCIDHASPSSASAE